MVAFRRKLKDGPMDEKLVTQCPACGLQLEVKLAWIGRSGNCRCGERFYIEPSVALKEAPPEADAEQQEDIPVHVVKSEDIFAAEDPSPEESLRRAIQLALKDGILSIDEQILLENLRHEYGLSSEVARQIFDEEKGEPAAAEEQPVAEPLSDDVAPAAVETEQPAAQAAGSGVLWLALGAAAAVGAYLYFSGILAE